MFRGGRVAQHPGLVSGQMLRGGRGGGSGVLLTGIISWLSAVLVSLR